MAENVTLDGVIERVVFRDTENHWTVLDLDTGDTLEKVVGVFADVHVGERLQMEGQWVEHAQYGRQFKMEKYTSELPTDTVSVLRYLSSGAVRGIGPATAARVVDKFGKDTLRILEEEPIRLSEVRGITREKAKKLGEEFHAQSGLRELMLTFSTCGLTQNEAVRCWKRFGVSSITRIRDNPYILYTADLGIPFDRADRLAQMIGGEGNTDARLQAGVLYVLRHNLGNGHTCLPQDKLAEAAAGMLDTTTDEIFRIIDQMVGTAEIILSNIDGRTFCFLAEYFRAEVYTARCLLQMAKEPIALLADVEKALEKTEKSLHIQYEQAQRDAIMQAANSQVMVLTGGPGTGKTTAVNGMIALFSAREKKVQLAAPTGRAAKRMTELTGKEAKTLHRLLEVQWDENDRPVFEKNEKNPLEADVVIVDEMSMVDALLFESLLRALPHGCRLIMVGDADQLPSVGAGCVLQALLQAGKVPAVRLTEIFRQAEQSQIVTGAHAVLAGNMPLMNKKGGDFFFMNASSFEAVADTIVQLCATRIPHTYHMDCWHGVQVLCPGRRQELGTVELNNRLQATLNPADPDKAEVKAGGITFRVGDKVMHNRNNYDITWVNDQGEAGTGIFNGDIGVLESIDRRADTVTVRYDSRNALYTREDLQDLELAYAVTVHKSQGSEFDVVIMSMFRHPKQLCYRHLLYTGITRAKKLLIMVGDATTLSSMIENNRKTLRYSGLKHFLEEFSVE